MHSVRSVTIQRFKRLYDVQLEMRPLMVMIGANGVGKSSILEALSLLAASAAGRLNQGISALGGIGDVITRDCRDDLVLGAQMAVSGQQPLEYVLRIHPEGQVYSLSHEALTQSNPGYPLPLRHIDASLLNVRYSDVESKTLVRPNWDYNVYETALSQVPRLYRQPEEFRKVLEAIRHYQILDIGRRSLVRLPQQMAPSNDPGTDGETLVSFLYNLREAHSDRFESIEDTLRVAFPGFKSMSFPPAAAGSLSLAWNDKHFTKPIYMHQISEGTLRFVWLISILQTLDAPTIMLIDEPELSLHPELVAMLPELFREASDQTQVIIATHSDRLVERLRPDEVVVMDIEDDGHSSIRWAESLDIGEWLRDYSLSELWGMGRIGARA